MKKLFSLILVLFSLIGLSSCIEDFYEEKTKYNVTFILDYNESSTTVRVIEGELAKRPEEPVREGYTFVGWFLNDEEYKFDKPVTDNIILSGVFKEEEGFENLEDVNLDLYYINDLHGSLSKKEDEIGLDYMANVIISEQENKDVLFIAGGDILQGQVESNHFKGESIIYTFNEMNLDAFILGNHEFDWGLETILSYFNGEHDIQANYPLLGANVFLKETNKLPNGLKPYTIVEKNGLDVLIIGVMGYGLESSIDGGLVKDYYFADPIPIVKEIIDNLKDEVDLIVVASHANDSYFNNSISKYGANVILNAHTHERYVKEVNGIPIIQSESSGRYLGKVAMNYNKLSKITKTTAVNLSPQDDKRLYQAKEEISVIIDYYLEKIAYLYETILISEDNYSIGDLAFYIAKVMREKTNADIAFHNKGGTKTNLYQGENISEATVLNIFPYDNFIITVDLKGSIILDFMYGAHGSIRDIRPNTIIEENKTYKVAVHSYLFNFTSNPFMYGDNIDQTNIVLREALTDVMRSQQAKGYQYFNINTPITFDIYTNLPNYKNNLFLSWQNRLSRL